MKKLYIDNIYKGDYLVSREHLNDIDHGEISCRLCEFKDITKFNDSKIYFKGISGFLSGLGLGNSFSTAIGFIGLAGLCMITPNISPAIFLTTLYGGTFAIGILSGNDFF
jgi:hypothetical protein